MDHYLDIRLWTDPDLALGTVELMNTLFAKLHRHLGQTANGRIGISFPNHGKLLGDALRLHGNRQDLQQLMADNWLQGLRDLTRIAAISPVPDQASHRIVRRVQAKSAHNKRLRSVRKGWLTETEAQTTIPDDQQKPLPFPYAELQSKSNGNLMRVYIQHGPEQPEPVAGIFTAYGLSSTATIPWF
ncbi:CRISPR-associated endonuclease Csy4 [Andreprevotia lacus DSM 23236]|jgi:CRISPR-associated endonuclease Csy4|uniref:CRISPR-associated endonuclease Csy4 n=1 Tax=Andreprevotia lacus DSM 23236 TaxID=1121001 RepID=A0A1W1X1M4_9NEIS|nr:type I-F CRISPR-associated endoribonuclease Cas6/Csy4 [Andreprevotia lacus]SMC17797.1 CRISPR-associated endonuclease Csy4 [Andreprevotia lacus DSM 23236]